jgi:hypothetical protein
MLHTPTDTLASAATFSKFLTALILSFSYKCYQPSNTLAVVSTFSISLVYYYSDTVAAAKSSELTAW